MMMMPIRASWWPLLVHWRPQRPERPKRWRSVSKGRHKVGPSWRPVLIAGGPDQRDKGGHCGRYVSVAVPGCEGHTKQFSIGGYSWEGRQGVEEEAQPEISSSCAGDE